jgi:hypothetical protein
MKPAFKKTLTAILASLALSLSLIGVTPAYAADVWYVAPGGNDGNSCLSVGSPCATIKAAIGKALDDDTIEVATGIYTDTGTEVVLINKNITLSGGWDAAFTTQNGMSSIDGQHAMRGATVNGGLVATIERFIIQNGGGDNGEGYGIYNLGTLTLNKINAYGNVRAVRNNGGTLTINDSAFTNNGGIQTCGGGIFNAPGTVTMNNSTISGNASSSTYCAPISGLATTAGGTVALNNVTITGNINGGIWSYPANATSLQNSIIAGNKSSAGGFVDCYPGDVLNSLGYNLIGAAQCTLNNTGSDQVGTPGSPIDPLLRPLTGSPAYHPLYPASPALNAGNPAVPGSGGNACLATDQHGITRPEGSVCDIGAYEGYATVVASVVRANPNPTNASTIGFTVTFSENVTGIDTIAPFSDFAVTTTGVTGASIATVSGSGSTYTVTVSTGSGSGNGSIRLDVMDDDSILDTLGHPLGAAGIGNGNFISGQAYSLLKVPTPALPAGTISDTTPTYKWNKILGATHYQYQLVKGVTTVYTKTVAASTCGPTTYCLNTPTNLLTNAIYKWRVRALIAGVWKDYSPYKTFTLAAPKTGFWSGAGLDFYVTPNQSQMSSFAMYVMINGCGSYKITHTLLTPIVNKHFAFTGSFYATGNFSSPTAATGTMGLKSFYIPGCGYITGGPFSWTAKWKNATQPTFANTEEFMPTVVTPALDADTFFFNVDIVKP